MDEKLLYRIPEVAQHLSLSRSEVYELVRAGVVPSVRIDRVRRVRGADVIAFVEALRDVAGCRRCATESSGEAAPGRTSSGSPTPPG